MSLMAMNRVIKRFGIPIGIVIGATMIGGVVMSSFGNYGNRTAGSAADAGSGAEAQTPVATVGDEPVTNSMLDDMVKNALAQQSQQMAMMGQPAPNPSAAQRAQMRYQALTAVQEQQAMISAAKKAGVTVSDADVQAIREKFWQQQRGQIAQSLGLTDKATDADIERELGKQQPGLTKQVLLARLPESALRLQAYRDKWVEALKKEAPTSEADVRRSYDDVQVRHILVNFGAGHLPEAQARTKAQKLLDQIKANPTVMASLAKQYSDDPGSKAQGGFYDWAPASRYVPDFTKAALTAGVGKVYPELVRVVQPNYSGFHIVKLEGERPGKDLPKDFDKNKQQYLDEYADKQVQAKMQAAITAETPNIKVTLSDPLLQTFQLMDQAQKTTGEEQTTKYNAALAELAKVKKEADTEGVVPQTKAVIYTALKNPKETIAALQESLNYGNTAENRIALAQAYLADKNKAEAAKQLDEAEKLAITDMNLQFQMVNLWNQVGQPDRAKAAQKKVSEMLQRMSQQSQPIAPSPAPAKAGTPAPKATPAAK